MADSVTGDLGNDVSRAAVGKDIAQTEMSNVVHLQAPESFLHTIYFLLNRLESKLDGQGERLRTMEKDIDGLKSSSEARRLQFEELSREQREQRDDIRTLQSQVRVARSEVRSEFAAAANKLSHRDRMWLWLIGVSLGGGVLTVIGQQVFVWLISR